MYGFCSQTVPSRGALFHPLSQTPTFLKIGASRKAVRAIASNFLQRPNYQQNTRKIQVFDDSNPDLLHVATFFNDFDINNASRLPIPPLVLKKTRFLEITINLSPVSCASLKESTFYRNCLLQGSNSRSRAPT